MKLTKKAKRRAAKRRSLAKRQLAKGVLSVAATKKKQEGIVPDWLHERMKES